MVRLCLERPALPALPAVLLLLRPALGQPSSLASSGQFPDELATDKNSAVLGAQDLAVSCLMPLRSLRKFSPFPFGLVKGKTTVFYLWLHS